MKPMREAMIKFYFSKPIKQVFGYVWRYNADKTDEDIKADVNAKAQNIVNMYDGVDRFELIGIK